MVKLIRFIKDVFFYLLAILMIVFILFFFYSLRDGGWMSEVVKKIGIKEIPQELRRF
jgi:predicted Na+-dependent transporter